MKFSVKIKTRKEGFATKGGFLRVLRSAGEACLAASVLVSGLCGFNLNSIGGKWFHGLFIIIERDYSSIVRYYINIIPLGLLGLFIIIDACSDSWRGLYAAKYSESLIKSLAWIFTLSPLGEMRP